MTHGFSTERLQRIGEHMDKYVTDNKMPCGACLLTRHDEEAYFHAVGHADVENGIPIARDTVFRIYSMTKPITSVALMMLYERGHFQLDDPIYKHIPEWENLEVYEGGDEEGLRTHRAKVPMTIKNLLTHTSGLTYGFMQNHPVDALYRKNRIGNGQGLTLAGMIDSLATLPLLCEPGSEWNYSVSTDVCGYLVELFSGKDLDVFVHEEITEPLQMSDSGFQVPTHATERLAACYSFKDGSYTLQDDPTTSAYHRRPTFFSGGGGMVSTIDDYGRFAQMLLHKGELDGVRLLGRKTVEYMASNHLPANADLEAMGQSVFSETSFAGVGFGLGFSVVLDPPTSAVLDSIGDFAWGGAASTYFWIDPLEDLTMIFMTQLLPSSSYPVRRELKTLVYQAIVA